MMSPVGAHRHIVSYSDMLTRNHPLLSAASHAHLAFVLVWDQLLFSSHFVIPAVIFGALKSGPAVLLHVVSRALTWLNLNSVFQSERLHSAG